MRSGKDVDSDLRVTRTWRYLLIGNLLGWQVIGIVAARFRPERYLCWAPYDEITLFETRVSVGARHLTPDEIQARYRLPDSKRDNRSWAHIPAAIAQYERTVGSADNAIVEIRYRTNGGPQKIWTWPPVILSPSPRVHE